MAELKPKTSIAGLFEDARKNGTYLKICAPMVRYSKLEFRNLVRTFDTDLTFSSMIMADSFCHSEKARLNEFTTNKDDTPMIVQFAANNTIDFLSAAEMVYPYSDGVDLNCGCPQRWAMQDGYGSALLKTPELIADMLATVRRNLPCSFSVSVKVRLLQKSLAATVDMCRQLEACGITFLTVHGRTAADKTNVPVNKDALKEIKASLSIPMVANGDIFSLQDADEMHRITGCDGVMSARGILSNPGLYAGHRQTPRECIQRWLDITAQADTDITYQAMHHHLSFMAESMLSKAQRVTFNGLSKDKRLVVDFLREHFQLEPRPCDHPPKLACTFDDGAFRKRAQADGRSAVGDGKGENGYASENTDGAFFKSMVDDLAKEDGDGGVDDVGVMGGLFGDEEI
ncbi:tRNA-dihydrouridine(20a/20b) synthase [NAD(P)+]-like [Culex pipiens pallens]|uniref:tRNA-dihydrouridine(20a/20b) synthase [NAD(P)+]-like n=1 Tax=Culex pipiens pallens TaxID=42434 RepID=UPI00195334DC|nr:tRNA-dihydrouridine(20a/20b) synthase [NAD(P)+]-like [Culex pipiens pallens]